MEADIEEPNIREVLSKAEAKKQMSFGTIIKKGVRPYGNRAQVEMRVTFEVAFLSKAIPSLEIPATDLIKPTATEEQILSLKNYKQEKIEVEDAWEYPYCTIGAVIIDCKTRGTGFIIGPQLILTCAQCCFDPLSRQEPKSIAFTPAPDFFDLFGKYKVRKAYYPSSFKEGSKQSFYLYDFAILELDTTDNLEEIYGSIGYDFDWLSKK